jgi:hypothetical protein
MSAALQSVAQSANAICAAWVFYLTTDCTDFTDAETVRS